MGFFEGLFGGNNEKPNEKEELPGRSNLGGKFQAIPEDSGGEEDTVQTPDQLRGLIVAEKAKGDDANLELISGWERKLENMGHGE